MRGVPVGGGWARGVIRGLVCAMVFAPSAGARGHVLSPVPRAGDWEATTGQASFLVSEVRRHGKLSIKVLDPTFVLSQRCTHGSIDSLPIARPTVTVSRRSAFSYRKFSQSPGIGEILETMSGRFLSSSSAIVRVREQHNLTVFGYNGACDSGTVTFRMHPAARVTIPVGIFTGTAANGEPVQVRVIQGGRMVGGGVRPSRQLIPSVQVGTFTTSCSSGTCTSTPNNNDQCARRLQDSIWIEPGGAFDLAPPDSTDPGVSGSFSGSQIRGSLEYLGNDASCSTTFTAQLATPLHAAGDQVPGRHDE